MFIPVVITTSSVDPEDVRTAYTLGANGYLASSPMDGVGRVGGLGGALLAGDEHNPELVGRRGEWGPPLARQNACRTSENPLR